MTGFRPPHIEKFITRIVAIIRNLKKNRKNIKYESLIYQRELTSKLHDEWNSLKEFSSKNEIEKGNK